MDADDTAVLHEYANPDLYRGNLASHGPVHPWRKCAFRYFSETAFAAAAEPKELLIIPGASHVDLYDRADKIPFDRIAKFFGQHLAKTDAGNQAFAGSWPRTICLQQGTDVRIAPSSAATLPPSNKYLCQRQRVIDNNTLAFSTSLKTIRLPKRGGLYERSRNELCEHISRARFDRG